MMNAIREKMRVKKEKKISWRRHKKLCDKNRMTDISKKMLISFLLPLLFVLLLLLFILLLLIFLIFLILVLLFFLSSLLPSSILSHFFQVYNINTIMIWYVVPWLWNLAGQKSCTYPFHVWCWLHLHHTFLKPPLPSSLTHHIWLQAQDSCRSPCW